MFVCISPWNFPLAIFTGQVAAALAAGNAVLAKPAEQTPRIAAAVVRLYHQVGLDSRLLTLLPGRGEVVGAALIAHPGCDGMAFTRAVHGDGLGHRPGAGRPDRNLIVSFGRRDRRPQRHVRRHHRPARAG